MEILDEDIAIKKLPNAWDSVAWWEKKRLTYNAILILVELTVMLVYKNGVQLFGVPLAIIQSIFYTVAANALYCVGWGVELLLEYYFKSGAFVEQYRFFLLVTGMIFSIMLTIWSYVEVLAFLDYKH